MFDEPKYSDLNVYCDKLHWSVHKAIVCPQSPFFAKACDGNFKEGNENVITLQEDNAAVVGEMLRYMYTFSYSDHSENMRGQSIPPLVFNVHMHILADKYDMPGLTTLAASKFAELAGMEWISRNFADAAALIFTECADRDHQLRSTIFSIIAKHGEELKHGSEGIYLRKVVASTPALGLALWRGPAKAHGAHLHR
ncbi:hypothetical protein LTR10_002370 [Elasticomyces elasticus]|nr:hypothetical protein LTR10_002370 [Elasticomyces elasticus]KAK4973562.1 hypothetical protein LTR42_005551 [Elasticomyces elasticus]